MTLQMFVESSTLSALARAAERSRARGDEGRSFVRAAERLLDAELVRVLEQRSGLSLADHLTQILAQWDGVDAHSLGRALTARASAHGITLSLAPFLDDPVDDPALDEEDDGPDDLTEHPHVTRLRRRGTVLVVIGALALPLALATIALSVALAVASTEGRFAGLVCALVVATPSALIGFAAMVAGLTRRARARRLHELEGLAFACARLPFDRIERELAIGPAAARALVREALGHGLLEGRLDLEEDVFVSALADERAHASTLRCRACGASSAVVRAPGIVTRCPYCGAPATRA